MKDNFLQSLYWLVLPLPFEFREMVCAECGWSEATFYRKARGKNRFSNAEREKIQAILCLLLKGKLDKMIK